MIPLFWMLSTSVKPKDQVYSYPIVWIPPVIIWQNYVLVFQKVPFARFLTNSTILSVFGIIPAICSVVHWRPTGLPVFAFRVGPFCCRHAEHPDGAGLGRP